MSKERLIAISLFVCWPVIMAIIILLLLAVWPLVPFMNVEVSDE